jgi:nitrous oxide reductase accessory protein NosL
VLRALAVAAAALVTAGCARSTGPPPITPGTPCVVCGMAIQDLRYVTERRAGRAWRAYDSIECLLRDAPAGVEAWLADYDSRTLHAADSMWVVHGDLPSPMGGGFAAFRDRAAADDVAARTRGTVDRIAAFRAPAVAEAPR